MQIRLATDQDEGKWNRFISSHPLVSPYHHFGWGQAVQDAYGMRTMYLMALDEGEQVIGVLPSVLIKRPLLADQLCSLPYCDRGEAIADSSEVRDALIAKARELAQQHNATAYEYRGTASQDNALRNPVTPEAHQKVRMLLELPESSELLLKGFKAKLRSQINKAQKNRLDFLIANSTEQLQAFYEVFSQNMRDLGSPTHSVEWFQSIRKHYGNNCIISIVSYEEKIIGAGIVLLQANTATIPWASTLREYNRLAPNMLLYWSLLSYASDHGCRIFDFGRSTYGEGTYNFKKQWGAISVPLEWRTFDLEKADNQSDQQKTSKGQLREFVEKHWKHIPLPITIWIGSRVRKYISL